jgi:hypothetical protein
MYMYIYIYIYIHTYIHIYILRCCNICFYIYPLIRTKYLAGLDPAGPPFTGESCEVRLCKGDAVFTEAIHTNGHPSIGEDGRNMCFRVRCGEKSLLM